MWQSYTVAFSVELLPPQKEGKCHKSRLMHYLPILLKRSEKRMTLKHFNLERESCKSKEIKTTGHAHLIKQAMLR